MTYILIDNENLVFLKKAASIEALEYWADILIPKKDFLITGLNNRDYSCYTSYELRLLYKDMSGETIPDTIEYPKLIKGVVHLLQTADTDRTSIEELVKRLGRPLDKEHLPPPIENEAPTKKAPGGSIIPNRPKEGTTTAKVWQIADTIYRDFDIDLNNPDLRNRVISDCEKLGINKSTAATQFSKWKRAL